MLIEKICTVCGTSFQAGNHWKDTRNTCSEDCRYALLRKKFYNPAKHVIRACVHCGSEFQVLNSSNKKLCSLSCKRVYCGALLSGPKNPNWKETKALPRENKRSLRKRILDRDKICQDCGSNKSLQVHHIDCGSNKSLQVHHIDSEPTNNDESNLVLLCKPCHAARHESMGEGNLVGLILVNRTYSQIPPRDCAVCHTLFKPNKKLKTCCSPQCAAIQSGLARSKRAPRRCIICGTTFTPNKIAKKCCSRKCGLTRPNNGGRTRQAQPTPSN